MNSRLRVNPATPADAKAIEALAKEIWEQLYTPVLGKTEAGYMFEKLHSKGAIEADMNSGYAYYLALFDGVPCGYSAVRMEGGEIYLSKLYVKKGYLRKGIARAMMDKIHEFARKNRQKRIWLTCNRYDLSLLETYKRLGFSIAVSADEGASPDIKPNDCVLEKKL